MGQRRVKIVAVPGNAFTQRAAEIRFRVVPDTLDLIGRDIGRVDDTKGRLHRQAAAERLLRAVVWHATQSPARARYSPRAARAVSSVAKAFGDVSAIAAAVMIRHRDRRGFSITAICLEVKSYRVATLA